MTPKSKKTESYAYGYDFSSEYVEEDQFECRVDSARTLFDLMATSFNKQKFSYSRSLFIVHFSSWKNLNKCWHQKRSRRQKIIFAAIGLFIITGIVLGSMFLFATFGLDGGEVDVGPCYGNGEYDEDTKTCTCVPGKAYGERCQFT